MNRRLFVSQLSAGLALMPLCFAEASPLFVGASGPLARPIEGVTALLRNGQIGTVQRLTMSRIYSPERTSLAALREAARQDFRLADQLLGMDLSVSLSVIFEESAWTRFGSYSARFEVAGLSVTWQGLARLTSTNQPLTGTLLMLGSKGLLQFDTHALTYQTVDFRGTGFVGP